MKVMTPKRHRLGVADEAWIALALLHREHPERGDFTNKEIRDRARLENLTGSLRKGVEAHISFDAVANKPANPGRDRMLYATGRGTRRLFREGDPTDPSRKGKGKITPEPEAIPEQYRYLIDWYKKEYAPTSDPWLRGIFEMAEKEKDVWAGIDADEYVRQLREGWD